MKQYRLLKWDDNNNLVFLGEEITDEPMNPGDKILFEDVDGKEKEWIISEVLFANPRLIHRPNGTVYYPDPIAILTKGRIP